MRIPGLDVLAGNGTGLGSLLNVEQVLAWVVPDVSAARRAAAEARAAFPGVDGEALARQVVARSRGYAWKTGAATGMVANPITAIPAAFADAAAMLRIEANMVATVAAVLDPDVLDDPDAFRADVVGVLFPAIASQALRAVGVTGAKQYTKTLLRQHLRRDVVSRGLRFAAKHFGMSVTRRAMLTKGVPVIGAGVGGTWNFVEAHLVGRRAVAYYLGKSVGGRSGRGGDEHTLPAVRGRKTIISRIVAGE